MKIIIDNRMREEEKEYLKRFGELVEIPKYDYLYEEISSHPDIFITKIGDKLICAPCIYEYLIKSGVDVKKGDKDPKGSYPNDILYNVFQIGKYVVGNFKYCDKKVLEEIEKHNFIKINVKQGYSNCSCLVLNDRAIITSDKGISDEMLKIKKDVLLLQSNSIKLLNGNKESKMNGFIGGATTVIDKQVILFGDIDNFGEKNKGELISFLNKYNMNLKSFNGFNINDYGGTFFT